MVLRGAERQGCRAVAEREDARLLAEQASLDHDLGAGFAREQSVDHRQRLLDAARDDHPLAGREPVGLHDDRRALPPDMGTGRFGLAEAREGGRRDAEFVGEILREALRAFELGRGCRRPEGPDPSRRQIVDEAGHQRRFRPDHHEVDRLAAAERDDRRVVGDVERDIRPAGRGAGIAGRNHETPAERARGDRPSESMFAPAGADEKDVHACLPGATGAA